MFLQKTRNGRDEDEHEQKARPNYAIVGADSTLMAAGTAAGMAAEMTSGILSGLSSFSCLTGGSSDDASVASSDVSSFLRFPLGAGSRGVRQYVTVRVTTWRTLTLPG